MLFHKYTNIFTAKSQRAQRVRVLFYPTVRGGRIKSSLSAYGRDLHRLFASKRRKAFSLAASHRQRKKDLLCELCVSAVRKGFVSIFLKMTTKPSLLLSSLLQPLDRRFDAGLHPLNGLCENADLAPGLELNRCI